MLTYISARFNLPQLPQRQRGLTTVEYAIAGALIVAVIVGVMTAVSTKANSTLNTVQSAL